MSDMLVAKTLTRAALCQLVTVHTEMADRKFKQQLSKVNVATIHIEMADRKFKQQLFKATDRLK